MPAYDFKCTDCDTVFEIVRPVGAASAEPCPSCGGETKRVFTPVGVVFKGSGFHNTDYKSRPKDDSAAKTTCEKKSDSPACASCPASTD